LVLSDFREAALMARFDAEFNEAPGTRANKLREALRELLKAFDDGQAKRVEIYLSTSRVPYSAYEFDSRVLFCPYIAEPIRDAHRIPALLFGDGGIANGYLGPDLRYLLGKKPISRSDLAKLLES
jgi:hypothetical protein